MRIWGVSSGFAEIYGSALHAILTPPGDRPPGLRRARGAGFDRFGQGEGAYDAINEIDAAELDLAALERPDVGKMVIGDG